MLTADIGQQTSFASHESRLPVDHRDPSSENDMTDEEGTVVSSDMLRHGTSSSDHSTPPSVDSSASKINPLNRHKSRTSCDGDIDDTDSEISPAGSFFHESISCTPSMSISSGAGDCIAMTPITIPRPAEGGESSMDGLFLICEALERPARRSGSTGTDRSSEISSPANSPLSGSPTCHQQPSLMSLRAVRSISLPSASTESTVDGIRGIERSSSLSCNYNLFDNGGALAAPIPDTYQQYSHHHSHHNHDLNHQQDVIVYLSQNARLLKNKTATPMNKAVKNSGSSIKNDNINDDGDSNGGSSCTRQNDQYSANNGQSNVSHFPLSTLFTAAEALLPGNSDKKGGVYSPANAAATEALGVKPSKRTYTKRVDKKSVVASAPGFSVTSGGKRSNAVKKTKRNTDRTLTEKDLESKKRKREADKSLSTKKRYDASEKLAIVVEKLRKYFAMDLHKL